MAKPPTNTPSSRSNASAGDRGQAPGLLLRRHVLCQFDTAIRALGEPRSKLRRGVHKARKALRRSVAVLDLASQAMSESAASVRSDIREAYRQLSPLRDADAVIEALDYQIEGDELKVPALEPLRARLSARRAEVLQHALTHDPHFRGYRERLRRLREKVKALPWEAVAVKDIRRGLDRYRRRMRRAKKVAKRFQTEGARHRWRRRLRGMIYRLEAVQWASSQCPGLRQKSSPIKKLHERITDLGHELDLRMLQRHSELLDQQSRPN